MIEIPGKTAVKAAGVDPYRVMVVDDSAVIRGLLRWRLRRSRVAGCLSVGDGQMAINALSRQGIDVIVLDIEMPVMDGLTAIPKLIAIDPAVKIIMASTLTLRGAEVSMKALQSGAADYVTKPSSTRELGLPTISSGNWSARSRHWPFRPGARDRANRPGLRTERPLPPTPLPRPRSMDPAAVVLRPMPAVLAPPDIIAIGSSTGGPQALFEVLSHLKGGVIRQPILITQHAGDIHHDPGRAHHAPVRYPLRRGQGWRAAGGWPHIFGAGRFSHGAGDQGNQHGAVGQQGPAGEFRRPPSIP